MTKSIIPVVINGLLAVVVTEIFGVVGGALFLGLELLAFIWFIRSIRKAAPNRRSPTDE